MVSIVGTSTGSWAKTTNLPFFIPILFNTLNYSNHSFARRNNVRYDSIVMTPSGEQLTEIARLLSEEKLRPVLDREYSLDHVKEALLYSQTGRTKGKNTIGVNR